MLKLTRTQRTQLFEHERMSLPHIGGDGDAPVSKGFVYTLSSKLELEVLRVDTWRSIQGSRWAIHYKLIDRRDRARLIRRTPPVAHFGPNHLDRDGFPMPIPDGEASEESSYTEGGPGVVSDAGEAPPRGWQEAHSEDRREAWSMDRDQEVTTALERAHSLEEKVVALQQLASRHNLRCGSEFRQVERLIGRDDRTAKRILQGVEDRVRRKAA